MAQLDPKTMVEMLPDTLQLDVIPGESPFDHQEGSSLRKISRIYHRVYARGLDLAYATSDKPTGPFTYCGAIVSQRDGAHGCLAQLNGQWHIFDHRHSNNTVLSRRVCVEPVTILPDGTIPSAQQISLGFEKSLGPYGWTPADIACVFLGGSFVTDLDKRAQFVVGNKNNCTAGYMYFDFGDALPGRSKTCTVRYRGREAATQIGVWLGDPQNGGNQLGSVTIDAMPGCEGSRRELTIPVKNITGQHAVYLTFASDDADAEIAGLRSFVFTRGTQ